MREAFGKTIFELAKNNKNIWVVSMDLKTSMYLNKFADEFPDRFVECGIAEQAGAGIAAGLAKTGKTVFLCSFACFSPALNFGVIRQSIAYNKLPVIIVGSHAGLMTGELGGTHQMLEDVALMRALPEMEVLAPIDSLETEKIVRVLAVSKKPAYLRLLREKTENIFPTKNSFVIGKSHILKTGKKVTILGYGPVLVEAMRIVGDIEIINCSSIKPLDETTILKSIKKTKKVIVIEDHQKIGGLGEAVASLILEKGVDCKFKQMGVDNKFGESGKDWRELYDHFGIGINNLTKEIEIICGM
jgi:transketolase